MHRTVIAMFALLSVVACVAPEAPPLRFRPRFVAQRSNARFARLEEAPPAAEEPSSGESPSTGYQYPKPTSSGYQYPKPDQAFPLPGEDGPTEVGPETTTAGTEVTTSAAPEDYEDSTGAAEDSNNGANSTNGAPTDVAAKDAQRSRLQQQVNRQPIRLTLAQRLEETEPDREPTVVTGQQPVRPVYLINLPESTLQQLILLSNPQPTLQLAPVGPQLAPTAVLLSDLDYLYTKK
ncbi:uncharacterized protein LOC131212504 [Anopheles bellator]|uniref:uncharacterized protein LOC131212504 n=1 Tax=Anopheles bellator TaxID=139047 RepID=UPI002649D31F|nr:uncharacterized protein LOC131212504 [Anopheles bellator]